MAKSGEDRKDAVSTLDFIAIAAEVYQNSGSFTEIGLRLDRDPATVKAKLKALAEGTPGRTTKKGEYVEKVEPFYLSGKVKGEPEVLQQRAENLRKAFQVMEQREPAGKRGRGVMSVSVDVLPTF